MLKDVTTTASGEGFAGPNLGAYTEFCISLVPNMCWLEIQRTCAAIPQIGFSLVA